MAKTETIVTVINCATISIMVCLEDNNWNKKADYKNQEKDSQPKNGFPALMVS